MTAQSLFQRVASGRAKKLATRNMGTRALLSLCRLLAQAGNPFSLATVRSWPKPRQGEAYLWALDVIEGRVGSAWAPIWFAEQRRKERHR